jgi:hypothetical protein
MSALNELFRVDACMSEVYIKYYHDSSFLLALILASESQKGFKPVRNREKTVTLHRSVKLVWRSPNSSFGQCLHDGRLLAKDRELHTSKGKIVVLINNASRSDAGIYFCRLQKSPHSVVFSSWLKLQVAGELFQ